MPIDPNELRTGGGLHGAVADSLLRERERRAGLAAGDRVGAWRILRELARGGMAFVYLAERADGEYEQRVALKWMLDARDDEVGAALFRRERQALADLRHPHIARLLDGGRDAAGRPWFAMELVEGERIDRHCVRAGLSLARRLGLFLEVCAAVAFAHSRGLIHRDIKPTNVLVDADGGARLLDFGIAQLLGEQDGPAAHACTPGYASPEQLRGERPTIASDVYQLGLLLGALACADEQAQDRRLAEVARTQLAATDAANELPLPTAMPADLAAILRKATASDAAERYASADAFADDVRAFLEHRPVRARPRRAAYLAARYLRRHPLGTAAAALTLALLAGGAGAFTWRLGIERDAAAYQARVATSVLDFLQDDLLAAADPAATRGREVTVHEALDLASRSAGQRFAQLPVELAAVRSTLARLYYKLGRHADAEREARLALAIDAQGPLPREQQLRTQATLADALASSSRYDEAGDTLAAVIAGWEAIGRPHSREAIDARFSTGYLLNDRGEHAEAEAVFARVADEAERHLDKDDALKLAIAGMRAANLQTMGRTAEAWALLEPAYARSVALRGEDHPETVETAHNIGVLLRDMGRVDEALRWLEPALARSRSVLGDDHPSTLRSANVLASAHRDARDFTRAEALYTDVLERRLRVLGEENTSTRVTMGNLGQLYLELDRPERAAPLLERALALDLRLLGERHPETLASMNAIARLYRSQRRHEEALAMHLRVLAGVEAEMGPDAWQGGAARAAFAETLELAGRDEEAEAEYTRAAALLARSLGATHVRTVKTLAARDALRARR
ncbi:MAG: serine/threonine protein kinase [Lysobacteraceae bacterium]|nr:MAG: serine/threonine protein kinase [Xanthomonadaceae bacterium]